MNRSRTISLTLTACFRQNNFSNKILKGTRNRSYSSSVTMPPFSYCHAPIEKSFVDKAMASPRGRTRVCFAVHVENLLSYEFVMVAGSCEELGKWDPQSAIVLTQDSENPTRWVGHVMTNDRSLSFRYFLAYKLSGESGERLIISRWESFLHPRSVLVPAEQRNGVCRSMQVDLFGYYAGQRLLSDGWLQHEDEYQIMLRLHGKALKFFKTTAKDRKNCRIRITPLDVRKKHEFVKGISMSQNNQETETCVDEEDDEEDTSIVSSPYPTHSATDIAVLSDVSPRFKRQPCTGVVFNNNKDYLVFKTHSVAVEYLAFYVEVFSEEQKRIGACYALPSSLSDSFGATQLPFINSAGRPIGQICLEYLFVRSVQKRVPYQTMEKSFARYWKKRTTLEVGHRGAGSSYTKLAMARENTIHSLNTAAKNGADFVEFDVQLTKDKIAVIYHDFHVLVSVAKRGLNSISNMDEGVEYHEIAVKDLKLNQLKLLMLDHVSKREAPNKNQENNEEEELKPFPTLVEALNKVDKDVGFNVEVKYPMMQTNGEHECDHYFERNEFVDIILADILNHASGRRIMFSSFDPDICSLISMKQNKYPVLFLCVGETTRYTPFSDQRTSTSLTAVNFAAGADILGVNFNSEDLLKDPYPIQRASEFGLVSFVWGDDLDKKETLNYFKRELGVDGLIYDRIGEEEGRRNVFIVEREQKRALFLASSGQSTPRAPSPVESVSSTSSNFSELISPKRVDQLPSLDMEINKINIHNQSPRVEITQS